MSSIYDLELITQFKSEIDKEVIIVHETISDFIFEIEHNYPVGFSGIDWSTHGFIYFFDLDGKQEKLKHKSINIILKKISEGFPNLLVQNVVVFGDGLTNFAYEMKFSDFITRNYSFFELPQHTYVWFKVAKKCINFTFESELFFG